MRLDSPVVAYPAWLGGRLPPCRARGNAKGGRPVVRGDAPLSRLAARRVAVGLTQADVAERLGVCRATVSRVETRPLYVARRDARITRLRSRLNALYLALEREGR